MSIRDMDPLEPDDNALVGLGANQLRSIKSDVQSCFPELEGPIQNGNVGETDPPDAAAFSGLFTRIKALETSLGGVGSVPLGAIMYWHAAIADIPTGWAVCDGSTVNGVTTPSVDETFLLAVTGALTQPLITGGGNETYTGGGAGAGTTDAHSLTVAELPASLNSSFRIQVSTGNSGIKHLNTGMVAAGQTGSTATSGIVALDPAPTGAGHTHSLGASSAHTHQQVPPPWIALAAICYVGVP